MCGIIGYVGHQEASPLLLDGLKKLEYRGYDSAGIALQTTEGISLYKTVQKVASLEALLPPKPACHLGLGHTRWATHGAPQPRNAHPHQWGRVTLVHNGIIENERALREALEKEGIHPCSDTDTELIAILIDRAYRSDPKAAIRSACAQLEGSYALGILFEDRPQTIYAIRKDSPLVLGRGTGETFLASDIPAFLKHTRDYCLLEEGELAELSAAGIRIYDQDGNTIEKPLLRANWEEGAARKGGYSHYMAKEIAEQPQAVKDTLGLYCLNGAFCGTLAADFSVRGTVRIVACGSAYHAGLLGKWAIEKTARVPVEVSIASEFRYNDPLMSKEDLVIIVSQSGETADSLAALRLAKKKGVPTLGIVNVQGSSIAREADRVLFTAAGPEISVATTKAYTCQAALLYLLALKMAGRSPKEIEPLPHFLEQCLQREKNCKELAKNIAAAEHLFFIGRGADYAVGCEGSLKLKEISYIHSEAYAAGELKHGTISLIEEGTPVIAIATEQARLAKIAANIREVRARGAEVSTITLPEIEGLDGRKIELPPCPEALAPFGAAVLCQMLAYHTAVARGNDVDQPRNLAKSVTVE